MKIVLCVKQVPDTSDIKWTPNNTIQREGLESIINPYDVYALESALSLKKEYKDVCITALTMGPMQAVSMLQKVLAVGADNAVLLSDRKFAGADTYSTGKTIARAIQTKLNDFDLIVCGQFAIDGDTAQTGPSIANFLNIPQVTYVKKILSYSDNHVVVLRELDGYSEKVEVELPALICVLKDDFEPTRADIQGVIRSQKADIPVYGIADIGLEAEEAGLNGSPTYVSKAFRAPKKDVECIFVENVNELAQQIKKCGGADE